MLDSNPSRISILHRRARSSLILAVILGLAATGSAHATTFALPTLGGVSEFKAFIRTGNLAVLADPVSTIPPVTASESQVIGVLGGSMSGTATADRGWLTGSYSHHSPGTAGFLDVESGFDLVDIVISGPGSSVNGSINLVREGSSSRPIGDDLTVFGTFFGIGNSSCGVTLGACFSQSIILTASPWNDTYVSPVFSLPVGVPFTFGLSVGTAVGGGASQTHGASWAVHFPVGSAVFNLPTGYTVDSVDGLISGNQFLVPEPGTALLLGAGLLGLALRRGARR